MGVNISINQGKHYEIENLPTDRWIDQRLHCDYREVQLEISDCSAIKAEYYTTGNLKIK